MEYKTDAVLDIQGNAVFNASIRVLTESRQLATVFNAIGVQIPNPVNTDKTGEFSMALPNGKYYWEISVNGKVYETKGPVSFFDAKDERTVVKDFGAVGDGITDDTDALNRAFAWIRANASTNKPVTLNLGNGIFRVTSVNATGIVSRGWSVIGSGAQILGVGIGKAVLDLLGSRFGVFSNFNVQGDSTNKPRIGIQIGRNSVAVADCHYFNNVTTNGNFTLSGFVNYASETTMYDHCRFWNSENSSSAYCLIHDGNNTFEAQSEYIAVTAAVGGKYSFNEILANQLDLRKTAGTGAGPALYIGKHSARHKFVNSYIAVGSGAAIVIDTNGASVYPHDTHYDLDLDIHCETTGLQRCVSFLRGGTSVRIKGFRFLDHANFASSEVFLDDNTAGLLTVEGSEIRIPKFDTTPANKMFFPAAKWNLLGDIYVNDGALFNAVNLFKGRLSVQDADTAAYGVGSCDIDAEQMGGAAIVDKLIKGVLRVIGGPSAIAAGGLDAEDYARFLPFDFQQHHPTAGNLSFHKLGDATRSSAVAGVNNLKEIQLIVGGPISEKVGLHVDQNGNAILPTLGSGLRIREGANCKQGVAAMSGGTVTVPNTSVTANSRIFPASQSNGVTGSLRAVGSAGVGFTITSNNSADAGIVAYEIFEPA